MAKNVETQRLPLGLVIIQWVIGTIILGSLMTMGYIYQDLIPSPADAQDVSERLSYAIQCLFPMALVMIRNVLSVSIGRGRHSVFNPLGGREHKIQVLKNILANTTEQLLISVILILVYACAVTSPAHLKVIPLYSLCFVVARVLFIIGYRISPNYRSTGMFMNYCIVFWLSGYLVYHYYSQFMSKYTLYKTEL